MTQILIMGDSWGVPEYTSRLLHKSPNPIEPFYSEPYHTEQFLRDLGYEVHNASHGGISNTTAIRNAIAKIANNSLKPDYIIWFHTALFRDFKHYSAKVSLLNTYAQSVEQLADHVYKDMSIFLKMNKNSKLIAIGGQAPLVKNVFDKYITPFFRIDDWRSEILNEKLPEFQAYGSESMISTWNWHPDVNAKLMSISELYTVKMAGDITDNPLFPDSCHPGKKPHQDLTQKIHNAITWSNENFSLGHGYIKTHRDVL